MPMYAFHIWRRDEAPVALELVELPHDAAAFAKAGEILEQHPSGERVEIWDAERPVAARYGVPPLIRALDGPDPALSASRPRAD